MLKLRLRKCSKRQEGVTQFRRRIKWFVVRLIIQTLVHMEFVLDQHPTSVGMGGCQRATLLSLIDRLERC